MKWSFRIGRVAGIDLYVHATFLILLIWLAANQYLSRASTAAIFGAIGFVLLIFVIIILHELGHALAARKYGIATADITLLPIGGVARLERIPEDPKQELVVAFAGPLVNFVIAAGIFVGQALSYRAELLAELRSGDLMSSLLWINVWLAFFNLLPAFPMDGGRVLRAVLALKLGRERATEIATVVGHVMALLFGAAGLWVFNNPFLIFIAFFIWVGADGELQQVRLHSSLRGISVDQVMTRTFDSIRAETPLVEVARRMVPGFQNVYPVFQDDQLMGFLSLEDLVRGLSEAGPEAVSGAYAQAEFEVASPSDPLEEVVADLQPGKGATVAVIDHGALVGIVTASNVGEHMMVRSALTRRADTRPPKPFVA